MWLFTKYGFYSVVTSKENIDQVMVRARKKEHLENLVNRFGYEFHHKPKILCNAGADYRYRVVVDFQIWNDVGAALTAELPYFNFKDEAKKLHDPEYSKALGDIWERMLELQENNASTPTRPRPSAQSSGRAGSGGGGTRSEASS